MVSRIPLVQDSGTSWTYAGCTAAGGKDLGYGPSYSCGLHPQGILSFYFSKEEAELDIWSIGLNAGEGSSSRSRSRFFKGSKECEFDMLTRCRLSPNFTHRNRLKLETVSGLNVGSRYCNCVLYEGKCI